MNLRRAAAVMVALVLLLMSAAAVAAPASLISYDGGPVLHSSRTHVIFWQPAGSDLTYDPGYAGLVDRFMTDVAADGHSTSNGFGITGQYTDGDGPAVDNSTFAGSVTDTDPLPANGCTEPAGIAPPWTVCLTDAQLEDEITNVATAHHLPIGPTDIYFLVTPYGLGSCEDGSSTECALGGHTSGYCGYHSATNDGLLYAVIPYNEVPGHCQSTNPRPNDSTADPALSTMAHELAETITDPLGDGWIDPEGNEIADVCITNYGKALGGTGASRWDEAINGHHYWLQELLSRVQNACEPRPQPDSVSIQGAGRVPAGRPLALTAVAKQPGGKISAYEWTFGPGQTRQGEAVTHTYQRAGLVRVTLRITDSAGNWAYATRRIMVTPERPRAVTPARTRAREPSQLTQRRRTGARSAGSG